MSILSNASNASAWRGYEYYQYKKVEYFAQLNDAEYEGTVAGSSGKHYHVKINTEHIRKSECDCPFAHGKRVICKHMVALYFSVFPKEAAQYIKEIEENEREEEAREQEHFAEIEHYVKSLTKAELRDALFNALVEIDEIRHYW